MEKFFLRSLLTISALSLIACSGTEVTEISGIDPNTIVSGSFTQYDNSTISGSGVLRFTEALTINSSKSFTLKASLDQINSSSVAVVFYSANSSIPTNDGVTVTFSRSGASVNGQISLNGNAAMVNTTKMSYYFPTSLDVIVEVHNVGSKARVLIWRRNMVEYAPETADVDSNRSGDLESTLPTQKGAGPYVGLIIQNSTVSAARLESQKVLD